MINTKSLLVNKLHIAVSLVVLTAIITTFLIYSIQLFDLTQNFSNQFFLIASILISFVLVIFLLWLSVRLSHLILTPVKELTHFSTEITKHKNFTKRAKAIYSPEFNSLVHAFNSMLDQIQAREHKLDISKERLILALEASNEGMWDINIPTTEIFFDSFSHSIIGSNDNNLSSDLSSLKKIIHPDDLEKFEYSYDCQINGQNESFECEVRISTNSKDWQWFLFNGKTVEWNSANQPQRLTGTIKDISRRKKDDAALRYLANYDSLTGLPNRTLFHDRLNQSIRMVTRKQPLSILFIDIDRFKFINDSLGHSVGDGLLVAIAKCLTDSVRASDTVSRRGGDEFTLLLVDINEPDKLEQICTKIMANISNPFYIQDHEINISISIGISIYPSDGKTGDQLLLNADRAMYTAKDKGRNNFQFYSTEMNVQALERMELENQLRKSIQNDEFFLHYQPKVDAKTGDITGSEALLRWNHPEFGMVSPATFIPLAESTGLIVPIGEWVLKEACRQHKEWLDQGINIKPVSVNISAKQFITQDMPLLVNRILSETGLSASYLDLELTEGLVMDNPEKIRLQLLVLKSLGLTLSIDDFGTGYSSLSYLQLFPLDTLKVDRSFIINLASSSHSVAISTAIIAMAHGLGLKVVVEGVETQQQLNFVLDKDVEQIQGYLFSKPLDAKTFRQLLISGVPLLPSE